MKWSVLCVVLLALLGLSSAKWANFPKYDNPIGTNWAVLVAGSNSWGNYRHQSDVYHSLQLLRSNGFPDNKIIIMHYDDIGNSPSNPTPGVIINEIGGPNVYNKVPKDYVGATVTPINFLAVIKGDRSAGGRVLQSGPNDNVFIFMCDHGATHIFAFPSQYLYADQLMQALNYMHTNKMYNKLVFYIEACESGSMFEGLLDPTINIYAMTASNAQESSWACCYDSALNTWLNDCWSFAWMNETEKKGTKQSLQQQFVNVRTMVTQSHVTQYGDFSWSSEPVGYYVAYQSRPEGPIESLNANSRRDSCVLQKVNNRYAEVEALKIRASMSNSVADRDAYLTLLNQNHKSELSIITIVNTIVQSHLGNNEGLVNKILGSNLASGHPELIRWDCYRNAIDVFEKHCGKLNGYSIQYAGVFENLCTLKVEPQQIEEVARSVCAI